MWPFKRKVPDRPSFPVGIYRLDMPITGLPNLVEFTLAGYAAIPRTLRASEVTTHRQSLFSDSSGT